MMKTMEQSIGNEINLDKYGDAAQRAVQQHIEFLRMMDHHDGYLWALLSTLRHFEWGMKAVFDELYERADFENGRWLIIRGTQDGTCSIKRDDTFLK